MSNNEIKAHVEHLGSTWEQFKKVNDRRDAEIQKKGSSDSLTDNQIAKLNNEISESKERMAKMEAVINRPAYGETSGYRGGDEMVSAHKRAFCDYLRKGVEGNLCDLETKALSVASDPDGGYLVSPQISEMIVKTVFETSPMRKVANIQTISSDSLEVLEDRAEAAAGWTTESGAVSDTTTPTFAKKSIPVHELYAQPKATQKLIDDAAIDIEAWLADKVAAIFSKKENTAFISGDGVGKPRGILTYASGTNWGQIEQVSSGVSGGVTADKIVELYYALKEDYSVNASFLMNRSLVETIRQLKDTTNQYIWNPGLALGAPDTLMGVPVYQAADMPVAAADSLSIACGDFKSAYQIVDRNGVRVLRDPFTDKPFVKFYSTKRVGGDVVNFEAIKLMKLGS